MDRSADPYPACPYCGGSLRDDQTYVHADDCMWRFGMADELAFRYQEIERLHLVGSQRQALLYGGIYPARVS